MIYLRPTENCTSMAKTKIGILKEGKIPVDRRVPFTPGAGE